MNYLNFFLTLLTGIAFLFYGLYYFFSAAFRSEFQRFGLQKFGLLVALLQILGGAGLLLSLLIPALLLPSSLGLAILMLLGVATRIKVKDSLRETIPAFFFMVVNFYLFAVAINLISIY